MTANGTHKPKELMAERDEKVDLPESCGECALCWADSTGLNFICHHEGSIDGMPVRKDSRCILCPLEPNHAKT